MTSPPRGEVGPLVHEVTTDTAADVAAAMGPDGELVAMRLARGCRCFAARLDDDVVAYGWLSKDTEWIGEVELEISPGSGEAYIWNCATHPAHRRKGLFRAVVNAIAARALAEGTKRLWIGTVDIPAAKAIHQAGFLPALRFTTVWMYGVRWLRVRPDPGVDPTLLEAARAVMSIAGRPLPIGASMKRSERHRH